MATGLELLTSPGLSSFDFAKLSFSEKDFDKWINTNFGSTARMTDIYR